MRLGIFPDELDLDERLTRQVGRRLTGLDDEIDFELVEPEIGRRTFYRPPKEPKPEISERLAKVRKKAQQARAIVNSQRRREPNLPNYSFSLYVIYFINHPNVQPRDILHIIREEQRKKAEAVNPGQVYGISQKSY